MSTIDTEDIITNHHCSGGGHLVGCNGPEGDYCLIITLADEIDALRAKVAAVEALCAEHEDGDGGTWRINPCDLRAAVSGPVDDA